MNVKTAKTYIQEEVNKLNLDPETQALVDKALEEATDILFGFSDIIDNQIIGSLQYHGVDAKAFLKQFMDKGGSALKSMKTGVIDAPFEDDSEEAKLLFSILQSNTEFLDDALLRGDLSIQYLRVGIKYCLQCLANYNLDLDTRDRIVKQAINAGLPLANVATIMARGLWALKKKGVCIPELFANIGKNEKIKEYYETTLREWLETTDLESNDE